MWPKLRVLTITFTRRSARAGPGPAAGGRAGGGARALARDVGGAIGRRVVDQNVLVVVAGQFGEDGADTRVELAEVLLLVVAGRDDADELAGHGSAGWDFRGLVGR